MPNNTGPSGYVCHTCSTPIIPEDHNASEIAGKIREVFKNARWSASILPKRIIPLDTRVDLDSMSTSKVSTNETIQLSPIHSTTSINVPPRRSQTNVTTTRSNDPDDKYGKRTSNLATRW
jgi:hypothetical protein